MKPCRTAKTCVWNKVQRTDGAAKHFQWLPLVIYMRCVLCSWLRMNVKANDAALLSFCHAVKPSTSYWHINPCRHGWSCLLCGEDVVSSRCGNNHVTTLAHWLDNASCSETNTLVYKACNRIWPSLHQHEPKGPQSWNQSQTNHVSFKMAQQMKVGSNWSWMSGACIQSNVPAKRPTCTKIHDELHLERFLWYAEAI